MSLNSIVSPVAWLRSGLKTSSQNRLEPLSQPVEQDDIASSSIPDAFQSGLGQATDTTFERSVLAVSRVRPVLAHFYNAACPHCTRILPELETAADSMDPGGSIRFVAINEVRNPQLQAAYVDESPLNLSRSIVGAACRPDRQTLAVNSHPLILFRDGEPVDAVQCNDRHLLLTKLMRDAIRKEDGKDDTWQMLSRQQPVQPPQTEPETERFGWLAWIQRLLQFKGA
jgi:thiol-disulfide isomerase/thioredoxin